MSYNFLKTCLGIVLLVSILNSSHAYATKPPSNVGMSEVLKKYLAETHPAAYVSSLATGSCRITT